MTEQKHNVHGNNLNDPGQRPADIADHDDRTREIREEQAQTGGQHDDEGHAPKLPVTPLKR